MADCAAPDQAVVVPDEALARTLKDALGVAQAAPLSCGDLARLETFEASRP